VRNDVVVLGAGPAGLAAAAAASGAGRSVTVVDLGARPGGQFYRHRPDGSPTPGQHGWPTFGTLRDTCAARGVRLLAGHQVFLVEPGHTVHTDHGTLTADAVVIATGAHDRPLPFPGWDLPGVLTPGGAQAVLKGSGVLPGKRIVVSGTGPFLLPVAAGLAQAGAEVAGVFEANDPARFARFPATVARNAGKLAEAAGYLAVLARHRVPVRNRHLVIAAHGDAAVEAVTVAKVDADWRPIEGSERRIDCDVVAIGCGFVPQIDIGTALGCATDLAEDGAVVLRVDGRQATSVPGVFAAGEVTGIGGARLSLVEGAIAGLAVSGVDDPVRLARLRAERARHTAFARALAAVYPVRDGWLRNLAGDTVLCRCEEVDHDAVREAVTGLGARDARAVKLLTRAGMGWCQGRMCGSAVACVVADLTGARSDATTMTRRILAQPVRLGDLANDNPEELR
jgi:NADPH-dependent 2,4-dienoyl-CoA reductase/sulfur reductase-like enzyme